MTIVPKWTKNSIACGRRIAALILVAGVAALGCATAAAPPPRPETPAPYRVGASDNLHITVLPEPNIERDAVVRPDGMISLELIGDVPAAGRTIAQISADVETRMARFKRGAQATVSLISTNSTEVILLGEIHKPSAFALVKDTRVSEAIAKVGGVTPFGWMSRIRVIRSEGGETVIYRVNLSDIQRGDLSSDILLTEGDLIYVPPTIMARIGYAVQAILFPISPLMGIGWSVVGATVAN